LDKSEFKKNYLRPMKNRMLTKSNRNTQTIQIIPLQNLQS
jgi:hypothetical protein